eukprot:gb/GEZN01014302.1/.p1 GENE.gb/GEZN01014302.1/~~gb/GEZN01014302.1/.p1  ORF type:complete len:244 (+),score=46.20 gb/GEZN01014302.1/:2-733(+)
MSAAAKAKRKKTQRKTATAKRQKRVVAVDVIEISDEEVHSKRKKPNISSNKNSVFDLDSFFSKYAGKGEDCDIIAEENLNQFCEDMGADPDLAPLVLAWKLSSKAFGELRRADFLNFFRLAHIRSEDELKSLILIHVLSIEDEHEFLNFYRWLFKYCAGDDKTVETEFALEVWGVVLKERFKLLPQWLAWAKKSKAIKVCTKDVWEQLLPFGVEISSQTDLSQYDSTAAWPSLFDDFVDHLQS